MPAELDRLKKQFDASRFEWIAKGHERQWAVLGDSASVTFYADYQKAIEAATKLFGAKPFLVQQVLKEEPTERIQHVFWDPEWAATQT